MAELFPKQLSSHRGATLKAKSGSDTARIPFAGTVKVQQPGAWVEAITTVPVSAVGHTIEMRDTGRIEIGDTLMKESDIIAGNSAPVVTVTDIQEDGSGWRRGRLIVNGDATTAMSLAAGDYLMVTSNLPDLYNDKSGVTGIANPLTADGTTGAFEFFTGSRAVDIIYSGSGVTTMVEKQVNIEIGETFRNLEHYRGADTHERFTNAIADTPTGGGLYVPQAQWVLDDEVSITDDIKIFGESMNDQGSVIRQTTTAKHHFKITGGAARFVTFDSLALKRSAGSLGTGDILHFEGDSTAPSDRVNTPVVRNCFIDQSERHAIYCKWTNYPRIENCRIEGSKGIQVKMENCDQVHVNGTYINGGELQGALFENVGGLWIAGGIGIENNNLENTGTAWDDALLVLDNVNSFVIARIDFETFWSTGNRSSNIALGMRDAVAGEVFANQFVNGTLDDGIAIYLESGLDSVRFGPQFVRNCASYMKWNGSPSTECKSIQISPVEVSGTVSTVLDGLTAALREDNNYLIHEQAGGLTVPTWSSDPAGRTGMIGHDGTNLRVHNGTIWGNS